MSDTARIRLLAGMIFAALAAIAVIAFTAPGRAEARTVGDCCNPWDSYGVVDADDSVDHGNPWDSNGGIVEHQDGVSWTDFVWPAKSARDTDVASRDNAARFRNTALFGEDDADRWDAGAGPDNTHWGSVGADNVNPTNRAIGADGVSWT